MTDDWTEDTRWAELRVQSDAIGVSLYEQSDEGRPYVVDETWLTDDEISERRVTDDDIIVLDGEAERQPRFTDAEYVAFLEWLMVSDPWPLDDEAEDIVKYRLNHEADVRGFDGWIEAYHELTETDQ